MNDIPAKAVKAAPEVAPAPAPAGSKVRVLRAGDGKISKGVRVGGVSQYFAKGDEVALPDDVAAALEDRGFVEVL